MYLKREVSRGSLIQIGEKRGFCIKKTFVFWGNLIQIDENSPESMAFSQQRKHLLFFFNKTK